MEKRFWESSREILREIFNRITYETVLKYLDNFGKILANIRKTWTNFGNILKKLSENIKKNEKFPRILVKILYNL